MGLFRKKKNDNEILKIFDGRMVKYVTKRVLLPDGTVNHDIVGKGGRIIFLDDMIKIFVGEKDIFIGDIGAVQCNMLLSGDGATVKGTNKLSNEDELYTVYFSYYRK